MREKRLLKVFVALFLISAHATAAVYYTYAVTTFSATIVGPSVVTVDGRRLLVNGLPFEAKGVCYSPTPPGNGPDFFWWADAGIYENDFENLRNMGANTIRTYNAGIVYFTDTYYWVYHDDGIPPDSVVSPWHGGGGSFDGNCYEITPPEGGKSFKTVSANWAGWGVFVDRKVLDSSPNNNDGTVVSGVTENSGKLFRALNFSTNGEFIQVPDSASFSPPGDLPRLTVMFWYYVENDNTSANPYIIHKYSSTGTPSYHGWYIQRQAATNPNKFKLFMHVGTGTGYRNCWLDNAANKQEWVHIAMVWNGSKISMFINGENRGEPNPWGLGTGAIDNTTTPLRFGCYYAGANENILIDELRIENRAMTAAEISADYNSGNGVKRGAGENTIALYHLDRPIYVNLSGARALKFWVKTPANLKVEIEAPKGTTQTKYISQFGWDGTDNWQEITIPAENWSSLDQVYCPFKVTIETNKTFYIDKVRWTGYSPYSDGGIPGGTKIETWGSGYFEARYENLTEVPEGKRCFITQPSESYAGWGLFLSLPHDHTIDLSGAGALKFWVKTPENLKVEIEAPKGTTQTKYISQFGWDGTDNWQEITIPAENWSSLDQVYCPFKVTIETNKTFYIDFVRWENKVPSPQLAVLENRGILDSAWSQRLYVVMGFYVDRSQDFRQTWVRENLKNGFTQLVSRWKDHPAVLIWAFGNEADVYAGRTENWFSLVQEAAQAAKAIDSNHPVMTVNQDITLIGDSEIGSADDNLTALDIWGVNVYYGSSFGSLFENYKNKSSKPLFLAEWGCDALDARDNTENEIMQAEYLENLWIQISENLSAENSARVCIGGTLFEWCDEWWKAGAYETHDNLATWPNPNYYDYVAGRNNMNEEWWGIMKFTSLESTVKVPRLAYYTLKELWQNDP